MKFSKLLFLFSLVLPSTNIIAGVTITGTRIIFPSNQQVVTVQLNNTQAKPALVQAWIDNGDPKTIPPADQTPFILTPPISHFEPNKGQMIRLISKGTEKLPSDRESLYWFNILDIPAQSESAINNNLLNIAIRSRIKIFYRPTKLSVKQEDAFEMVSFKVDSVSNGIIIDNPSPYYMSFFNLILNPSNEKTVYSEPLMVEPFSQLRINPKTNFKITQIEYSLINDYGADQTYLFDTQ